MKTSACIDALYGEIPFLDRFQAAKDDGFDAVEFWGWPEKDLNAVKEAAEKTGIQMNLEGLNITTDHVGNFLKYTSDAAEMIRLIGSPKLKVLYDAYHMQINEGCICDTIRNFGDTFGHVHIADAPGRHEPGTGEIYYPRVYKALEEVGYQGYVGYELFPATTTAEAVKAIFTLV